jgi:hypothetical protein
MTTPQKRTPGGNRASADDQTNVSILPIAQKRGNRKNGHNRYARHFPERLLYVLACLSDSEVAAWLRLTTAYVIRDGLLVADDAELAKITRTGRRWAELREKLILLGLGRIEKGLWIDDNQDSSLALQRTQSLRGSKGAAARWGGRNA